MVDRSEIYGQVINSVRVALENTDMGLVTATVNPRDILFPPVLISRDDKTQTLLEEAGLSSLTVAVWSDYRRVGQDKINAAVKTIPVGISNDALLYGVVLMEDKLILYTSELFDFLPEDISLPVPEKSPFGPVMLGCKNRGYSSAIVSRDVIYLYTDREKENALLITTERMIRKALMAISNEENKTTEGEDIPVVAPLVLPARWREVVNSSGQIERKFLSSVENNRDLSDTGVLQSNTRPGRTIFPAGTEEGEIKSILKAERPPQGSLEAYLNAQATANGRRAPGVAIKSKGELPKQTKAEKLERWAKLKKIETRNKPKPKHKKGKGKDHRNRAVVGGNKEKKQQKKGWQNR